MTNPDKLSSIIDRIATAKQTEEDIAILQQQLLSLNDRQLSIQLGKYNVNITEGKDIHIGDRIYYTWDDEALHALVCMIRFGESIKPKIREKQDYYQSKVMEINNETQEKIYQLKTKYQDDLIKLESDYKNTLMIIEAEHLNTRNKEIDRIIVDLRRAKSELEQHMEQLEKNWSDANSGWPASDEVNRDYSQTSHSARQQLIKLESEIKAFSQIGASLPSQGPRIPDVDTYFENQQAKLNKDIAFRKQELELNLAKDQTETEANTKAEIQRIEKNGREEIYRFIIQFYLSKEGYPFSPDSLRELEQFQLELKIPKEEIETIEKLETQPFYQENLDKYKEELTKLINEEGYPLTPETTAKLKQTQESLGLRNPDIVSAEKPIIKPLYQKNLDKYKGEFTELMNEKVNALTEQSLTKLRNKKNLLGLNSEDVEAIEQLIVKQFYQISLDKYEEEFTELINKEGYPLSHENIANLKQRQELLRIKLLGFNREDIVVVKRIIDNSKDKNKAIDYLSSDSFKEDYQKLRELLASNQWKEANEETKNILFRLTKITQEKVTKITETQIRMIDILQVEIIDMLWNVYSKGKFSFHKQRDIFITVGKDYKTFSENIGWKKRVFFLLDFLSWKSEDKIMFSIDAPEGHLPFWRYYIINPEHFLINLIDSNLNP